MAGFCRNCGAQLEDGAKVCGQCGVPIQPEGMTPKLNIPKVGEIDSQTKEKAKKIGILAGAAVIAIIIIVIVVKIISANTGYRGTLNKFFKSLQNGNAAGMVSCVSGYLVDWGDDYSGDIEEYLDEYLDRALDTLEDEVGADPKISYEIKQNRKLSDRKVDKLKEMIENYNPDFDVDSIKAARNLDLKLTVKGRDDSTTDNMNDVCVVKEGGKWKIIAFDGIGLVP